MRTLVWFRGKDARVIDHEPLARASRVGEVIPLFVLDPYFFEERRAQQFPNRIQFLLDSVRELAAQLEQLGSKLLLVEGRSVDCVPRVAQSLQVDQVLAYRWTEPFGRERDARISAKLAVPFVLFEGETLLAPDSVRSSDGRPYRVFTAFARSILSRYTITKPVTAVPRLPPVPSEASRMIREIPSSETLHLECSENAVRGGEFGGRMRLRKFLAKHLSEYDTNRNRLDLEGTSRLSQDLKFGTVSARTVWHSVRASNSPPEAKQSFLNQLLWREFAYHLLWNDPTLLERPFRTEFEGFPWLSAKSRWEAWVFGMTGFPIVDASARQLLRDGFVHNRARMISASFLTKHLLIDYKLGESHYMRYLTDGDWAVNNLGWQWSAGCGCDAQPFFRVFNPVLQGKRFDPEGSYVRRYVPELAGLATKYIHEPWKAPASTLLNSGIRLGRTYPRPIVDADEGRERFLTVAKTHLRRARGQ